MELSLKNPLWRDPRASGVKQLGYRVVQGLLLLHGIAQIGTHSRRRDDRGMN